MHKNITDIHMRGDKLEDLELKAEKVNRQSMAFQKNTKRIKNKTMMENNKMKIAVCCVGGLLILIIIIIIAT